MVLIVTCVYVVYNAFLNSLGTGITKFNENSVWGG